MDNTLRIENFELIQSPKGQVLSFDAPDGMPLPDQGDILFCIEGDDWLASGAHSEASASWTFPNAAKLAPFWPETELPTYIRWGLSGGSSDARLCRWK